MRKFKKKTCQHFSVFFRKMFCKLEKRACIIFQEFHKDVYVFKMFSIYFGNRTLLKPKHPNVIFDFKYGNEAH